jgi:chromate transporter
MMNYAWVQTLLTALKLGLTSFGGPAAHIGFFREEYVNRKRWLDDASFADLVALCQLLPGPASSQVGIGIGWMRGGLGGAIAAWVGFTLPSALVMGLFAYLYSLIPTESAGWLHGLECAAIAIVAHALLGMGRALAPDRPRITIAVAAAACLLLIPTTGIQVVAIGIAGLAGTMLYRNSQSQTTLEAVQRNKQPNSARRLAIICLGLFLLLLIGLPLLRLIINSPSLALFESFYRSGSLVFGGGHVVLPLLEREVVPMGWVSSEQFIAGYAATQAMPGPLFTFAAFLGASAQGPLGAVMATFAVFLPGFLLVLGVLPFWQRLKHVAFVQAAIYGINAAVVGILFAALYDPLFTSTVRSVIDFVFVIVLYVLFAHWKCPPWLLILIAAIGGALLSLG